MRRIKALIVILACLTGLIAAGCGQKTDKKAGTDEQEVSLAVSEPAKATDDSSKVVPSLTGQPGVSIQVTPGGADITGGGDLTGGADITGGGDLTGGAEITGGGSLTGGAEITGGGNPTGGAVTEAVVTGEATKQPTPVPTVTKAPVTTPVQTKPTVAIKDMSAKMYSSIRLNVRASNTTNSDVLGVLDVNESIEVTGLCDNGWARVNYKGKTAYVSYKYLSSEKVVEKTPTPKPITSTPKPNTSTPQPQTQPQKFAPVNDSYGKHSFNQTYHDNGQSYYKANYDIAKAHLKCVNDLRASLGLESLTLDSTVSQIASYRTAEMVALDFFSHYHPGNGTTCAFEVVYFYQDGYSQIAENISHIVGDWGYFYSRAELGEELFNNFKNSDGHYKNMTNPKYTKIGLCVYVSDNYALITQIFE